MNLKLCVAPIWLLALLGCGGQQDAALILRPAASPPSFEVGSAVVLRARIENNSMRRARLNGASRSCACYSLSFIGGRRNRIQLPFTLDSGESATMLVEAPIREGQNKILVSLQVAVGQERSRVHAKWDILGYEALVAEPKTFIIEDPKIGRRTRARFTIRSHKQQPFEILDVEQLRDKGVEVEPAEAGVCQISFYITPRDEGLNAHWVSVRTSVGSIKLAVLADVPEHWRPLPRVLVIDEANSKQQLRAVYGDVDAAIRSLEVGDPAQRTLLQIERVSAYEFSLSVRSDSGVLGVPIRLKMTIQESTSAKEIRVYVPAVRSQG